MAELRKVQVKREDEWITVMMKELKVGDVFRAFELTGEPVGGEWTVVKDPELVTNENGESTYGVVVE